jgi:hypothetical protein
MLDVDEEAGDIYIFDYTSKTWNKVRLQRITLEQFQYCSYYCEVTIEEGKCPQFHKN